MGWLSYAKRFTTIIGIIFIGLFFILVNVARTPPISKEYAMQKMQGKSTEGIDKFQKGWQFQGPLFYAEVLFLIGGISLIVVGIKKSKKCSSQK